MNASDIDSTVKEKLVALLNSKPAIHEEFRKIEWLREQLGFPVRGKP